MDSDPGRHTTRRELLKLSPLLALGAFAVPGWRDSLLEAGLGLSDAASSTIFRGTALAPEFGAAEVVPPDRFPYNYFNVVEPEIGCRCSAVTGSIRDTAGMAAFPSFGDKVPQQNLIDEIPEAVRLGGWLGGALQWHFTVMWIFAGAGVLYLAYQIVSGHYRTVLFVPRDIPGVWPMARHYFLFGPKPAATAQYNPLQLSTLGLLFGGYRNARIVHFVAMGGLLSFIPGHLVMVATHGWDNFQSMVTGWKRRPEYAPGDHR